MAPPLDKGSKDGFYKKPSVFQPFRKLENWTIETEGREGKSKRRGAAAPPI